MYTLNSARPRRLSGAPHPGGAGQSQNHFHQGGYLRGQTQMEDTADVAGAKAGGEEFEKQTQARVRVWYTSGRNRDGI